MVKYDEHLVCKLYLDGDGPKAIGIKTGLSRSTIYKIFKRNNVAMRTLSKGLSDKQQEICTEYLSGQGVRELAKKYNVDKSSIVRYLNKNQIQIRSGQEQKKLRFPLREIVFDNVNEESAYWVGMLMSDGCVYVDKSGSYRITLSLKVDDIAHIELFRDFLGSKNKIGINRKIKHGKTFLYSRIIITSNKIAERLMKYGVKPRKSLTAKVVGLENDKNFWRGMVDGDGWVKINKHGYPVVGLCGSRSCCKQFRRFVLSICPDCKSSVKKIGKISYWRTVGRHAVKIIDCLYSDNIVSLKRKCEVAVSIIGVLMSK